MAGRTLQEIEGSYVRGGYRGSALQNALEEDVEYRKST